MAILRPSYDELVARFENTLRDMAGITQFGESSVAGAIARILAIELTHLYDLLETLVEQSDVTTATGAALDRIGNLFGVYRRRAQPATSLGAGVGVVFTNTGNVTVTVPAGTTVWSSRYPHRRYRTVSELVIPPGMDGTVHVVAVGTSEAYHVGARELDSHDLGRSDVRVTNPAPIQNAVDVEDDESYRARIMGSFLRRYFGSESYIRSALEELPGISRVELMSGARGPGTLDVLVVPQQMPPSPELMGSVTETLRASVVPGIDWRLRWPRLIPVDVQVKLVWRGAPVADAYTEVAQAVRSVIDNLPIDEYGSVTLSVAELVQAAMSVHSNILSVDVTVLVDGARVHDLYTAPRLGVLRSRYVDVL